VAALIDAARTARADAERLRLHAIELRAVTHANLWTCRSRTREAAAAAAAAATRACRERRLTSPWSTLEWLRDDPQLERVLVLH
jgi:hypothetical protein